MLLSVAAYIMHGITIDTNMHSSGFEWYLNGDAACHIVRQRVGQMWNCIAYSLVNCTKRRKPRSLLYIHCRCNFGRLGMSAHIFSPTSKLILHYVIPKGLH